MRQTFVCEGRPDFHHVARAGKDEDGSGTRNRMLKMHNLLRGPEKIRYRRQAQNPPSQLQRCRPRFRRIRA